MVLLTLANWLGLGLRLIYDTRLAKVPELRLILALVSIFFDLVLYLRWVGDATKQKKPQNRFLRLKNPQGWSCPKVVLLRQWLFLLFLFLGGHRVYYYLSRSMHE